MIDRPTRVLIADDSEHARDLLSSIVESEPSFQVIGMAKNGKEAIAMAMAKNPDVIIMDLMMPELNGFEATKEIMKRAPTQIIAVSGVFNKEEISQGFQALNAGAITVIEKPKWISEEHYLDTSRFIVETIKALTEAKAKETHSSSVPETASFTPNTQVSIIGIGASLGGPSALFYILSKLPPNYPIPIVIYQQIPPKLIGGLVEWLNGATSLNVKIASQGEKIFPGHVYLQPEGRNIQVVRPGIINLTESSKFPIDMLFKSLAVSYSGHSAAILFKGIGNDGEIGIETLSHIGATTLVQNTTVQEISERDGWPPQPKRHTSFDEIVRFLKDLGSHAKEPIQN